MTTKLMSSALKSTTGSLSNKLYFDTYMKNLHGNKPNKDKTVKNYTNNHFRVVIGSGHRRQDILKRHNIPGYKVAMWQMDSPITPFWEPRVLSLAKELGVRTPLDVYEE